MVTTTAQDLARMKNKITRNLRSTMNKLKSIAGAVDSVRSTIEAAGKLIEGSIDTLTETPLELAQSVISLLRAPARVVSGIKSKVEGYRSLITTACADIYGLVAGGAYAATANELMGLWLAIIDSTTEGTLSSRGEAVAAREALLSSIARLEAAIDYLQARGYQPDAQVLAMLADLKAQAAGYLLESAYSLPSERVKVLSAASHPLELAHELYGSTDEAERLIAENGWGGDMILSLPVGTEVHYYA
jgi:hypothetical protein